MDRNEQAEWRQADQLFQQLLELPEHEQSQRLGQGDTTPSVRRKVEALLKGAERQGLLESEDLIEPSRADLSGRTIGSWQLEQEIGRGGMATVYRARRQQADYHQVAALKLLSTGLLAAGDIHHFRREHSLLAQLAHPNIAGMIEGGVTEDGTPFLAMELLNGQRIDQYCRKHGLSHRQVAKLMTQACAAVGYAHNNLVLHRDIKPSNLIVTEAEIVKLVDFGIGRLLTDQRETQTQAFTPDYAAPEQLAGEATTTQTDVFGLGAVLLACLVDERPFAQGRSVPLSLDHLDGDLANIVRMALREEPQRRYPTAQALGDDLNRWLRRRPVEATPDSFAYRTRKYLSRHKTGAVALGVAAAVATGGVGSTLWQAQQTRQEATIAEAAITFLTDVFQQADPSLSGGESLRAIAVLDAGAQRLQLGTTEPAVAARLHQTLGETYLGLGAFEKAQSQFKQAALISSDDVQLVRAKIGLGAAQRGAGASQDAVTELRAIDPTQTVSAVQSWHARELGLALVDQGDYDDALPWLNTALTLNQSAGASTRLVVGDHEALATYHSAKTDWTSAKRTLSTALALLESEPDPALIGSLRTQRAHVMKFSNELEEALTEINAASAQLIDVYGERHPAVLKAAAEKADIQVQLYQHAEATETAQAALAIAENELGAHPTTAEFLSLLATIAYTDKNYSLAAERMQAGLNITETLSGPQHPLVATGKANLSAVYRNVGDLENAQMLGREAVEIADAQLEPDHRLRLHARTHYANALRGAGKLEQTEQIYRQALEIGQTAFGEKDAHVIGLKSNLGGLLSQQDRASEAVPFLREAFNSASEVYPAEAPPVKITRAVLLDALIQVGETDSAAELLAPLAAEYGSESEKPEGRTVLLQAKLANAQEDFEGALSLVNHSLELLAAEPDGGLRFRPAAEALQTNLLRR